MPSSFADREWSRLWGAEQGHAHCPGMSAPRFVEVLGRGLALDPGQQESAGVAKHGGSLPASTVADLGSVRIQEVPGGLVELIRRRRQVDGLQDQVREQEGDVERGISDMGDLEVDHDDVSRCWTGEHVLGGEVAVHQAAAVRVQLLDHRLHVRGEVPVAFGDGTEVRIGAEQLEGAILGHPWRRCVAIGGGVVPGGECGAQDAGGARAYLAGQQGNLPVVPLHGCTLDTEDVAVGVDVDQPRRPSWGEPGAEGESLGLGERPTLRCRPGGSDAELGQRLLQDHRRRAVDRQDHVAHPATERANGHAGVVDQAPLPEVGDSCLDREQVRGRHGRLVSRWHGHRTGRT